MPSSQIVEPGRYEYDIEVKFDSYYIPDHTPPALRQAAARKTMRTRRVYGQFDLAERVGREALRDFLARQVCEDLSAQVVQILRFDLTPSA